MRNFVFVAEDWLKIINQRRRKKKITSKWNIVLLNDHASRVDLRLTTNES